MDVRPVKSNPNPLIETLSSEATPLTELDSTDPADPTDPSDPSNRDDNDLDWNFNQQIPAEIVPKKLTSRTSKTHPDTASTIPTKDTDPA